MPLFEIGDWVNAETPKGMIFSGWILALPQGPEGDVCMQSIQPRRETPIFFNNNQVVGLPTYIAYDFLYAALDLALATKDREWFDELMQEISLYEGLQEKEAEIRANWNHRRHNPESH